MPKTHFCKRAENGTTCGEMDETKFESGRYSICRECRLKENYISMRKRREKDKVLRVESIADKSSLLEMARDTFLKLPIDTVEIPDSKFESISRVINKIKTDHTESINIMNLNVSIFQKAQNDMRKKYDDLSEKYDHLKEKYEKIEKYCISMNSYVKEMIENKTSKFIPKDILE